MSDIWFIFDNTGNYLFRTTDKNRANLTLIPSRFKATYIIRNPTGFDSERNQNIHYDIQSNKVIFSDVNSISDIELPTKEEQIDVNYAEIEENISKLFEDRDRHNSVISDHTQEIETIQTSVSDHTQEIETIQSDLEIFRAELFNLIKTFNNIFRNNN